LYCRGWKGGKSCGGGGKGGGKKKKKGGGGKKLPHLGECICLLIKAQKNEGMRGGKRKKKKRKKPFFRLRRDTKKALKKREGKKGKGKEGSY